jgi:hypothetical protein
VQTKSWLSATEGDGFSSFPQLEEDTWLNTWSGSRKNCGNFCFPQVQNIGTLWYVPCLGPTVYKPKWSIANTRWLWVGKYKIALSWNYLAAVYWLYPCCMLWVTNLLIIIQLFSDFSVHENLLGCLVLPRLLGLTSWVSDKVGLGWGLNSQGMLLLQVQRPNLRTPLWDIGKGNGLLAPFETWGILVQVYIT